MPSGSGARRGAVREERAFAERLDLRLVVHVVPAAAEGEREDGRGGQDRRARRISPPRPRRGSPPSVSMKRNVSPARNRGSRARIMRKYRSRDASWKRGTEKTGWYGIGSPFRTSMPEDRRDPREEDRALERDRDERHPAVVRAPADVERVVDHRRPVLEAEARRAPPRSRRRGRGAARATGRGRSRRSAPRSG